MVRENSSGISGSGVISGGISGSGVKASTRPVTTFGISGSRGHLNRNLRGCGRLIVGHLRLWSRSDAPRTSYNPWVSGSGVISNGISGSGVISTGISGSGAKATARPVTTLGNSRFWSHLEWDLGIGRHLNRGSQVPALRQPLDLGLKQPLGSPVPESSRMGSRDRASSQPGTPGSGAKATARPVTTLGISGSESSQMGSRDRVSSQPGISGSGAKATAHQSRPSPWYSGRSRSRLESRDQELRQNNKATRFKKFQPNQDHK
jgi:hypothetical protein